MSIGSISILFIIVFDTGSDNVIVGDNGWLNGNWKLYGDGATLTVEDMSGTGIDVYGSGNGLKIQQH